MNLKEKEEKILIKILERNGKDYENYMENFGGPSFPDWKIDEICDFINEEFMMKGVCVNDEPNGYGIQLEEVLNVVNRQRSL